MDSNLYIENAVGVNKGIFSTCEVVKMKPVGRSPKPFTDTDLQMIKEYLETDKSLKEVAGKYGISDAGLRYKVKKYRKEQEVNGKQNNN